MLKPIIKYGMGQSNDDQNNLVNRCVTNDFPATKKPSAWMNQAEKVGELHPSYGVIYETETSRTPVVKAI